MPMHLGGMLPVRLGCCALGSPRIRNDAPALDRRSIVAGSVCERPLLAPSGIARYGSGKPLPLLCPTWMSPSVNTPARA